MILLKEDLDVVELS